MVKNIILDVGKVLVAWEPEDAMKQLGFDDKTVKAVADATVNTPVWLETDRGVWSDEQILQAFYEKAPEYKMPDVYKRQYKDSLRADCKHKNIVHRVQELLQ